MIIHKTFRFDSAHYLPNVPEGHKCGGMHGHTYTLKVYVKGKPSIYTGWIMDFTDLKNSVMPWIDLLDHQVINTIEAWKTPLQKIYVSGYGKKYKQTCPTSTGLN